MSTKLETATAEPKRRPGRPRVMTDEAIYLAGLQVLAEVGSERLTLVRLARVLGVTPAAVRQRFGSKRGLLVEMSRRRIEQTEQRFAAARQAHDSPLEALQAAFVAEMDMIAAPQQVANAISAYTDNIGDDEMRAAFATELAVMERHISELLAEAADRGEIEGPVTAERVSTVLAAVEGTMLVWAIAPRGDIKQRIREAVEVTLGCPGAGGWGPSGGSALSK
jgi:AcrR family transcriptional regulator